MGGVANAISGLFKGPPKPPDMRQVMAMQENAIKKATAASMAASQTDQITPYGSITYSNTGQKDKYGNPYRQVTQKLSPDQQAILDALEENQIDIGQTAKQLIGNTFDRYTNTPDLTSGTDSIVAQRMAHMTGYMDPFYKTQTEQLDNRLRNQGLVPGMPGYDNAMRTLRDNQNQSIQSFLAQVQPAAFQQAVQEYGLPMDTAFRMLDVATPASLNKNVVNTPQFTQNPVNAAGIASSNYNDQMTYYNANNQLLNSLGSAAFGAITGLPSMGGLFGASTVPGTAANGGWTTTTTPSFMGGLFG